MKLLNYKKKKNNQRKCPFKRTSCRNKNTVIRFLDSYNLIDHLTANLQKCIVPSFHLWPADPWKIISRFNLFVIKKKPDERPNCIIFKR